MLGINKGPIVLGLETVFIQARADLQPQPLGKGAIIGVVIQNRLNNMDGTGNNVEIMVGFGTGQVWQMLPGQESPIIYAADLEDIYIRTRVPEGGPDPDPIDVPVIVYRERRS